MTWLPILRLMGVLLLQLSVFMLIPALLMLVDRDPGLGMLSAAGITALAGLMLYLPGSRRPFALRSRQLFAATTLSWVSLVTFATLPLILGPTHLSVTDAVFESVSGITTTGATVMTGLDDLPRGVLLWRSLIQWIGGIGIIVMGIAILPFLSVGGMRLFHTESSDWSEKAVPRTNKLASAIGIVYLGMSALCALLYYLGGMSAFDAICHAMTTLATGGFANYDASFGHFAGTPYLLVVASVFMLASGLPYVLYVRALQGQGGVRGFFGDEQVRGVLVFVLMVTVLVGLYLLVSGTRDGTSAHLHALFNVVSVVTTTGYASDDYASWGGAMTIAFLFLMFVGGASGSTSGGMKMFRTQLGFAVLQNQLRSLVHPRGVFTVRYNGRAVPDEVLRSVLGFAFFFFLTIAALALGLALLGLDPLTSLSGAVSAVTNVGPGLGERIGPAGNFQSLPDAGKWLLGIGMLLGRLEIMTVIVLLTPAFWRG
jgi:trk system potassium uptake protein TrkH